MINLLKKPIYNIILISIFTAFYTALFLYTSGSSYHHFMEVGTSANSAMALWNAFLLAGNQRYIAYTLLALTVLVVVLLLFRRPFDEYHRTLLANCLIVAMILILLCIAVFFLLVLFDPTAVVEKFMLFATLQWATIVVSNLFYLLICGVR